MVSCIAARLKNLIQCACACLTRRDARTGAWAAQALSGKRILWRRTRLSACATRLEHCFARVSTALDSLAGRSSALVDCSRRLLNGESSIFQSAIDTMERPLNFNDECLGITARVDQSLALVADRIGRLHRFKLKLDRNMAPLKILQTMFRIESAGSPPGIRSLFVSLSAEIEHLMGQMSELIGRQFEAIGSTEVTVLDVAARVRVLHARQTKAAKGRTGIQRSMSRLESQFEEDKVRDQDLVSASQAISGKIAGMVGALQYQDILNQRLQHVIQGLTDMAEESRNLSRGAIVSKHGDALCFLRDASRVESAQLEEVEEVLDGAVADLRKALAGLAQAARHMGPQCITAGSASPGASLDGMIRVLLETIQENTELIESTTRETCEIAAALEPIGGLLGNLTGSILNLSARIRLIALNAQVQAAQADEGTGLEVLACNARSVADEMAAHVEQIADELAALKQELAASLKDMEYTHSRSTEFLHFLLQDGKEQQTRLHLFRDRTLADLRSAADLVAQIETQSGSLSASLDTCSEVLAVIGFARNELENFSERLFARLWRDTRSTRLEEHARSYTAASEHAVHVRALQGAASGAFAPSPVPAMAEGSVELF